jgi:hypothetical protein
LGGRKETKVVVSEDGIFKSKTLLGNLMHQLGLEIPKTTTGWDNRVMVVLISNPVWNLLLG